jgi:putative copper resistance protein D
MFMIAKAILYFSFAVLIGTLILYTVPKEMRPEMKLAKRWLLMFLALIPILGIGEIMRLTLYLGNDIGYWITFENIVTTFEVGKGWLFLTGISVLLFFMISFNDVENERFFSILSLILVTGMAISIGYSSHAASLSPIGLIPHILHFLAVTIWSGVLLVTGFFSKGKAPGISFYKWFTPLAFVCLLTVIGAGLWLMSYIVPEYVNGYMLDYGQALLIKHVLLVVIVFYIKSRFQFNSTDKMDQSGRHSSICCVCSYSGHEPANPSTRCCRNHKNGASIKIVQFRYRTCSWQRSHAVL